ncbi:MAG: type II toxin-antitoxin system VapC family toxin [Thermoplasmatota archaeon]
MTAFVDTSLFVAAYGLDGEAAQGKARTLLAKAERDGGLATSPLVVDEVLWVTRRLNGNEAAIRLARHLLATPGLAVLPLGAKETSAALDLMAETGLKPHDAFHAALALGHGCSLMLSLDADFDRVEGLERRGY